MVMSSNGYDINRYLNIINGYKSWLTDVPSNAALLDARLINLGRTRFNTGCLSGDRLTDTMFCDLFYKGTSGASPWLAISKRKDAYTGSYISYTKVMKAFKFLREAGYIEVIDGFYDRREGGSSARTRIRARQRLLTMIKDRIRDAGMSLYRATEVDVHPDDEPRLDVIIFEGSEPAIGSRLDRATKVLKYNLKIINTNNLKQLISHPTADTTKVTLHRIFNSKDLKQGGRFYGGFWIGLSKEERAQILINGNPVIELDYGSTHIQMLYDLVGQSLPEDPYIICGYERKATKTLLLTMVNASSQSGAIKAYISEQKKRQHKAPEKQLPFHSYEELRALSGKLLDKHSAISAFFFSGIGISMQSQDAAMAERIMLRFIKQTSGHTAILPVHESFIVDKRYKEDIMEIMLDEFKNSIVKQAIAKKESVPMSDEQIREHIRSGACFVSTDCWIKANDKFVSDSNGKYDKEDAMKILYGSCV